MGWAGRAYFGGAFVPLLCLLFVRRFVAQRPLGRAGLLLFVLPALTAAFAVTNGYHHLVHAAA